MRTAFHLALWVLWLPAVAASAYLLLLTLLSGALPVPPRSSRRLRFDVIVPAHDEAAVIVRTVASLRALDWPADRFRVRVVADNCGDATAALARAAGAEVIERTDPQKRGKGHALEFAFRDSLRLGWADAIAVVDADTQVSANLLEAYAARIERGAHAVQAHYGVLNPRASWRTRLMTIAMSCFHRVRSRTRERLALSCGIRGNGWCVTPQALAQVPYRAYSLAEDLEYGIALGLAGIRVHYAEDASVDGEMAAGARAAGSQRRRWEFGRFQLIRAQAGPLLAAAARRRSRICADLALDLLLLPLSYLALHIVALTGVAAIAAPLLAGIRPWAWLGLGLVCGLSLALHVLRGWQLSGLGLSGLAALGYAPVFLAWKTLLMLRRQVGTEWVRTERERP